MVKREEDQESPNERLTINYWTGAWIQELIEEKASWRAKGQRAVIVAD